VQRLIPLARALELDDQQADLRRFAECASPRERHAHAASLGSIGLCITLWIRAKTVDQDERGNAERRALFVGLWPPMFWLIGDTLERHRPRRRFLRGGTA